MVSSTRPFAGPADAVTRTAWAMVLVAPLAAAQIPPVIVTATRSPEVAAEALADVTVIGREEIVRAGGGALVDLLQRQPGIEITRNGGPAGVSGVFLRGTNRGQTIVLVDGVRIGSASTGAATLEAIPLADIDHVEIVRGPASGLYGADAIGGVIQVFTRSGSGAPAASVRAGYGTHDTRELGASVSGVAGPVRFAASGSHRASAGFNAITDPADFSYNPDRDGFVGRSGSASAGITWHPGQELDVRWLQSDLNAQFDAGPGHDDRTVTRVETASIDSRNRIADGWTSRVTIAESTDDSVSRTGDGDFPFRTRMRQYTWLNDVRPGRGSLTLGAERREERIDSDAAFAVTSRDTNAALALYEWRGDPHTLQANVRRDDSSQFGGRTTGGVRYAYQLAPALQASIAADTAFKAPSFNDLYYPGFSNQDLLPEQARNAEIGLAYRGTPVVSGTGTSVDARATAYRNRVRDLIVFQCDASFVCAPQNVDRATLSGLTLAVAASRAATDVKASLDLQDPRDDRTGHLLPRRARAHGTLGVLQRFGAFSFGGEVVASSHRFDDVDNVRRLAGYTLLNLTAEWNVAPGWSILVRGDNVLDRPYELAAGYGTGGASAYVAVRWRSR